MTYLKINDTLYPATIRGRVQDREWDNRESLAVTLEMTYEEAASLFVDGLEWYHIYEDDATKEQEVYNDSDYSVAGSITDNRNGTVTVKMGKPTEVEVLQKQLANAVTEEELEAAYTEGVNSL